MQERFKETSEHFSATRDTFTARMQSYVIETNKYLEAAIIGERGNGLKFVSETIRQNNWQLYFQSELGTCLIDKNGISFSEATVNVSGCLAIIRF
jgi:hypothetical protein